MATLSRYGFVRFHSPEEQLAAVRQAWAHVEQCFHAADDAHHIVTLLVVWHKAKKQLEQASAAHQLAPGTRTASILQEAIQVQREIITSLQEAMEDEAQETLFTAVEGGFASVRAMKDAAQHARDRAQITRNVRDRLARIVDATHNAQVERFERDYQQARTIQKETLERLGVGIEVAESMGKRERRTRGNMSARAEERYYGSAY
ncbi:hypothetical protein JCM8547_005330 [Rhodosporidiobolus lusitaniae]